MNLPLYPGELLAIRSLPVKGTASVPPKPGGWLLPTKVGVLLSPVILILGLNVEVFYSADALAASRVEAFHRQYGDKSKGEDFDVTFSELATSAAYPETRSLFEGKVVRISGRYVGEERKRFTLIRYRMTCCAADAVPLSAVMMVDPDCSESLSWLRFQGQWVEVQGEVRYLKIADTENYVCAVLLKPEEGMNLDSVIKVIPRPENPYIN